MKEGVVKASHPPPPPHPSQESPMLLLVIAIMFLLIVGWSGMEPALKVGIFLGVVLILLALSA